MSCLRRISDTLKHSSMTKKPKMIGGWRSLFFLTYLIGIRLRFAPFDFRTLAGDDIYLLGWSNQENGYSSKLFSSFTQHTLGKWRPIPQVVISPLLDFFGGDFWKYQFVNEALLASCALAVASLVYLICDENKLFAFIAGCFVVFTQFNLYHVMQVLGLMECLAFLFSILVYISLAKFRQAGRKFDLLLGHASFALAIHTHERFLFLLPGVTLLILFSTKEMAVVPRVLHVLAPALIAFENFAVKSWVFGMNFFTGAGGTEISADTTDVPAFFSRAILNILGFNSGPDYLSGRNANLLGTNAVIISLLWAVPTVFVIFAAIVKKVSQAGFRASAEAVVIFSSTIFGLALSASISFRQEFRWLFAPYLALVTILFSSLYILFTKRRLRQCGAIVLLFLGLLVGGYYGRFAERTYFFETQSLADSIKERVLDQYADTLDSTTFVIVTYGTQAFDWAIGGGLFFTEYAKHRSLDLRLVKTPDDLGSLTQLKTKTVVFENRNWDVVQISP
jgi:hypothetical protein